MKEELKLNSMSKNREPKQRRGRNEYRQEAINRKSNTINNHYHHQLNYQQQSIKQPFN